ncbi:hypothetical protein [Streptomyces eurythermus]|uniref:hypothetical protein n=1 Tax=Streptomyces eurythermus TaxID=42237 RepID=UPI0033D2BFC2
MTGSRTGRLAALTAATATLVLGTPSLASAQCAAPTYHGGLPLRVGECPETVAGGASAGAVAFVVLAAVLGLARALSRGRATTDGDLTTIDEVFGDAEHGNAGEE